MNTFTPTIEQRKLLDMHLELIIQHNKVTNLTRIDTWEQGQLLHIEDSLVGVPEFLNAPEGRYADIGTGGGFPGIPLAIVSQRETLLVDSVGKKTKVLDSVLQELKISDRVSIFTGRTEELALQQPEAFSVITARALSSLPSLLELASPLLMIGGQLICYKAQAEESEIKQACGLEQKLGLKLISQRKVFLSDNETMRQIFVFEKVSQPTVSLPRRAGMAQKRPYTS